MEHTIQFLLRHGYVLLFIWVFAEQLGLPVPSIPALLAMGALAGRGEFSYALTLAVGVLAALSSDFIWFELGRHRGHTILSHLCRISLEPDSCVRRTENVFIRYGARSLLVSKFVPGLGTVAAPLAGMFGVRVSRFVLWDASGDLLWAGTFSGLGYLFMGPAGAPEDEERHSLDAEPTLLRRTVAPSRRQEIKEPAVALAAG